jgi:hypothetical protein
MLNQFNSLFSGNGSRSPSEYEHKETLKMVDYYQRKNAELTRRNAELTSENQTLRTKNDRLHYLNERYELHAMVAGATKRPCPDSKETGIDQLTQRLVVTSNRNEQSYGALSLIADFGRMIEECDYRLLGPDNGPHSTRGELLYHMGTKMKSPDSYTDEQKRILNADDEKLLLQVIKDYSDSDIHLYIQKITSYIDTHGDIPLNIPLQNVLLRMYQGTMISGVLNSVSFGENASPDMKRIGSFIVEELAKMPMPNYRELARLNPSIWIYRGDTGKQMVTLWSGRSRLSEEFYKYLGQEHTPDHTFKMKLASIMSCTPRKTVAEGFLNVVVEGKVPCLVEIHLPVNLKRIITVPQGTRSIVESSQVIKPMNQNGEYEIMLLPGLIFEVMRGPSHRDEHFIGIKGYRKITIRVCQEQKTSDMASIPEFHMGSKLDNRCHDCDLLFNTQYDSDI